MRNNFEKLFMFRYLLFVIALKSEKERQLYREQYGGRAMNQHVQNRYINFSKGKYKGFLLRKQV